MVVGDRDRGDVDLDWRAGKVMVHDDDEDGRSVLPVGIDRLGGEKRCCITRTNRALTDCPMTNLS